nr:935_t:CDS:2 [Entrophospora candida]
MDTNNSNDDKLMNLSNSIKKVDNMLELLDQVKSSFTNIHEYLEHILKSEDNKNKNVDLNKFNRLNNSCVSSLKDFSILLESSSKIANKWKGSIQIPDKEFSQLNLNETKSIDYGEKMKKSSQEAVK